MRKITFLVYVAFLANTAFGQQEAILKKFDHFQESRGNMESGLILTLPHQEMVRLEQNLKSNSGLGPSFNYYGTVVVIDQVNVLENGNKQVILRREDGRDFYGYRPTLKAILVTNIDEDTSINVN